MIDGTISHYELTAKIGQGGMGIVYQATDTKLERQVAIKSIPPELARDETVRSRFLREAKLLAALNHPGIATIHDIIDDGQSNSYLVMEYIPGDTLEERLAPGAIPFKQSLSIASQIAQALVAAHEQNITHRDLKPANIKLLPDGRIKVLDFGLGKVLAPKPSERETLTQPGRIMGTTAYMSPEQARGQEVDERSDIWAFGCIFFEMLSGKMPFSGATDTDILANILAREPDWHALPKELHAEGRRILSRCLEKQPEKRFQSAVELGRALEQYTSHRSDTVLDVRALEHSVHRPRVLVFAGLILVVAGLAIGGLVRRSRHVRAAMRDVPEIIKLIESDQHLKAFQLAKRVERILPNDATLKTLWPEMSKPFSIHTMPEGAQLFFRRFDALDSESIDLGTSPLVDQRIPFGVFRFEIHMPGFETRERIVNTFQNGPRQLTVTLKKAGSFPGMIAIGDKPDYYINKFEVTNRAYKAFVDQGGYEKPEYWKHPFVVEGGSELTFAEAMDRFRDQTNRYGPAIWEGGTYAEGQDDFPVAGVSWFEAAAYAEFVGKSLPPIPCWQQAASVGMVRAILPHSNFSGKLAPVGAYKAITADGVYDMAGNVREWCYNAPDESNGQRYIRGGACNDKDYMFTLWDRQSPWNRDGTNGFRCVQFPANQGGPSPDLFKPKRIADWIRTEYPHDYQPKSEEKIQDYLEDFAYDPLDLHAKTLWEDDAPRYWRRLKVSYAAAYDNETIPALLFLPKKSPPPFQPIIFFPGQGAQNQSSSENLRDAEVIDFVIKSGRAVLHPIYKGTYERRFEWVKMPSAQNRNEWRAWIRQLSNDVSRSIDYLASRGDMDMDKLTYYGLSWGAMEGPVFVGAEAQRFRFTVFYVGGLLNDNLFHERVDPINYLPTLKMPVLMINGKLDAIFPFESSAKGMFDLLGSKDKQQIVYEGGHTLFGLTRTEIKGDVLQWMDDHLGPAE